MRGMCISQRFPPHVISKFERTRTPSELVRMPFEFCPGFVRRLSEFHSKSIRILFEVTTSLSGTSCSRADSRTRADVLGSSPGFLRNAG